MTDLSSFNNVVVDLASSETKKEPNNFPCNFEGCNNVFNRRWKLFRHICTHTGKRPFKCNEVGCSKAYQCRTHLQRHVKTAHLKLNRLACTHQFCEATFSCKSSLIKHCKNHEEPNIFQCSTCSISFSKLTKLRVHEKSHEAPSYFSCPVCNSTWPKKTLLRRHMRSHAILECEFTGCSFFCNSRPEMRYHEKIVHPIELFCDFCNKSYNNKATLRDHIATHIPKEQRGLFFCPHMSCVRAYFQKRNLRHHLKVFHNKTRHYCLYSNCYSSFDSQIRLEYHVKRHHERNKKATEKLIDDMAYDLTTDDDREISSLQLAIEPQCILEVINH